jgi:hypothetical protein
LGGIGFAGNQVLSGTGTVVFGRSAYDALYLATSGTTLVIGSGIIVREQAGVIGSGAADVSVVNQGMISANVSGGGITINAQPFTNQGLAQGINGGVLVLQGAWSNGGTLGASGGVLNLGGSFSWAGLGNVNGTNGTVYLSGALNNTNATLTLSADNGEWVLNGGTIAGGAVTTAKGGGLVVASGTLDGVTVNGVLDVGSSQNGASLTVRDGLVLNGTAYVGNPTNGWFGGIGFAGNQVLSGTGKVVSGRSGCAFAE